MDSYCIRPSFRYAEGTCAALRCGRAVPCSTGMSSGAAAQGTRLTLRIVCTGTLLTLLLLGGRLGSLGSWHYTYTYWGSPLRATAANLSGVQLAMEILRTTSRTEHGALPCDTTASSSCGRSSLAASNLLSASTCKSLLRDSTGLFHSMWSPAYKGWLGRGHGEQSCFGEGLAAERFFNETLTGAHCDRNWHAGHGEWPNYPTANAPALLGISGATIMNYCLGILGSNDRVSWEPAQQDVAKTCVRASQNILRIGGWTMCSNLEWLVCAAKGRLPGQGNAHINFATAPKTLRTDIERSPARRGGSDIPIFEHDAFYYETCLYSQLCSNGSSLFELEQGEVFECELSPPRFRELQSMLQKPSPSARFQRPLALPLAADLGANYQDEREWSLYLSAVYHEPVALETVDLTSFGWFYHRSLPEKLRRDIAQREADQSLSTFSCGSRWMMGEPPAQHGVPWKAARWSGYEQIWRGSSFDASTNAAIGSCPENKASRAGFFVHSSPLNLERHRRVEVMHIKWLEEDNGLAWFWPRKGTGVFIDLDALRSTGRILELQSRSDWGSAVGGNFPNEWHDLAPAMAAANVSVLHILNSKPFSTYPGMGELIVRSTKEGGGSMACPLPDSMLSTGHSRALPCSCDPTAMMINCDRSRVKVSLPLHCTSEGSVVESHQTESAQVLDVTRRCQWSAQQPTRDSDLNDDCPEARAIDSIASGRVSRKDVEVVIAHYDEDLAWATPLSKISTVYTKANRSTEDLRRYGLVHKLQNVGREQHTMLNHIVANYDRLALRTVFLHGRQASCGFFTAAEQKGGHLLLNVSIIDYATHQFFSESQDPLNRRSKRRLPQVFMPLTARFDANLTMISFRSGFADLSQQENGTIKQNVQRPVSPFATGDVGDHWLPWEQMDFANFIARQYKGTAGGVPYTLHSFFKMVFGRPPPNVIYYAQGGVFAAAPDAIRFIPRRTYEFIMHEIEAGHEELVYLLEVTWWYLLGGEMEDESIPALNLPRSQLLPTLSHLRQVAHRHLSDENGYGWVLRDPPSPPPLPPSPLIPMPRSPPSPSPIPPPQPQSEATADTGPVLGSSWVMVVTMTVSGDVSDYTASVRDEIVAAFAKAANVEKSRISLSVEAASVRLAITIVASSESEAQATQTALGPSISSKDAATALLPSGFSVESMPTVAVTALSPDSLLSPPPPSDSDSLISGDGESALPLGLIAGAGGGVAGLAATLCLGYLLCKRNSKHRSAKTSEQRDAGDVHMEEIHQGRALNYPQLQSRSDTPTSEPQDQPLVTLQSGGSLNKQHGKATTDTRDDDGSGGIAAGLEDQPGRSSSPGGSSTGGSTWRSAMFGISAHGGSADSHNLRA